MNKSKMRAVAIGTAAAFGLGANRIHVDTVQPQVIQEHYPTLSQFITELNKHIADAASNISTANALMTGNSSRHAAGGKKVQEAPRVPYALSADVVKAVMIVDTINVKGTAEQIPAKINDPETGYLIKDAIAEIRRGDLDGAAGTLWSIKMSAVASGHLNECYKATIAYDYLKGVIRRDDRAEEAEQDKALLKADRDTGRNSVEQGYAERNRADKYSNYTKNSYLYQQMIRKQLIKVRFNELESGCRDSAGQ